MEFYHEITVSNIKKKITNVFPPTIFLSIAGNGKHLSQRRRILPKSVNILKDFASFSMTYILTLLYS